MNFPEGSLKKLGDRFIIEDFLNSKGIYIYFKNKDFLSYIVQDCRGPVPIWTESYYDKNFKSFNSDIDRCLHNALMAGLDFLINIPPDMRSVEEHLTKFREDSKRLDDILTKKLNSLEK